ncbi:hypothetical protein HPB48_003173 [Haemaphysalis longicornis]|uniref:C2H2-type domain-containing protein n=1 Tax=Haemaphysalis longicornis TaxID=44386 RepID=A0A9J6H398_HAELO|nr:hypothetical protein HPB48_003173 [Haemaphysalis longicornis]
MCTRQQLVVAHGRTCAVQLVCGAKLRCIRVAILVQVLLCVATSNGFLCPACLRAFPSADALQDHYETSHGSGLEVVCPTCRMRLGSEVELQSHCARHHTAAAAAPEPAETVPVEQLQRELEALHASLREERSCSQELRTEVSRLHGAIVSKGDSAKMLRSQVRALEEGKALLTSELVLARQQLGSDLQQARTEASQLRTQLEQMVLAQPKEEVARRDAQVQVAVEASISAPMVATTKDDESRAAALAALTAEKQTLQLKLEEADRRLAEARTRADKARHGLLLLLLPTPTGSGSEGVWCGSVQREAQHREALERSEAERRRLLEEVEAGRAERTSLASSLQAAQQDFSAAKKRTEELESALASERQYGICEIKARQAEVDSLQAQLAQLTAVESALRDTAQAAQAQLAEYRAHAEGHAEEAAQLEIQLRERERELSACREQLSACQREAQVAREELVAGRAEKVELAQAVQALHQAKSRLSDQVSSLELEVGNLRNSQVALEADRAAFEAEAQAARGSLAALEEKRAEFEAQLTELQRKLERQAGEHQKALQGVQVELARAQNKVLQTSSDLEAEQQRSARQEAGLEALREQLASEQTGRQAAQTQLDAAQGDKLELEAKLENALDERRALLDRCLRSEAEAETLRTNAADLRRRLDDSLAALHELGRENQLLQMDNAKHHGRKWADDSQVTHCTGCEKLFTVTIRKVGGSSSLKGTCTQHYSYFCGPFGDPMYKNHSLCTRITVD